MSRDSNSHYYQQEEPHLGNQYLEDSVLRSLLKTYVPDSILASVETDLIRLGDRVSAGGDILKHGRLCETNPPKLIHHNAFGRRVDEIETHPSWQHLIEIAAEEGIIGCGYERKHGKYSRLIQMVKVYLFSPASAVADCPLSMTDGGARLIEQQPFLQEAYKHFVTRDPSQIWTSGQWMTEKTGGSDLRGSETRAVWDEEIGMYRLYGYKYFTSATTSQTAFTLARTESDKNLACFFLSVRQPSGELNSICIHRLKNKFGTKAVPTAELELQGTPAVLVGSDDGGIKVISSILNITRIHNATNSVAYARRALAVARDYAGRRQVLGRALCDNPLHVSTLAAMELDVRGCQLLVVDVCLRMGEEEVEGGANKESGVLLRLLTPLLKLYAGGTGYMEDSFLPVLLRDSQVTSIWEGTTNVLSHDVWRPLLKQNAGPIYAKAVKNLVSTPMDVLSEAAERVVSALDQVMSFAIVASKSDVTLESNARNFAISMARVYIAALLIQHASRTKAQADFVSANRMANEDLFIVTEEKDKFAHDRLLGMDIDSVSGAMRGVGEESHGRVRARF